MLDFPQLHNFTCTFYLNLDDRVYRELPVPIDRVDAILGHIHRFIPTFLLRLLCSHTTFHDIGNLQIQIELRLFHNFVLVLPTTWSNVLLYLESCRCLHAIYLGSQLVHQRVGDGTGPLPIYHLPSYCDTHIRASEL